MKLISIETTENKGKTETERLEPESIEKLSSDVSEQHRRVSVKTQKKLLSDFARSLGRERSPKKTADRSTTIQRQEYHEHSKFYNQKENKTHLCSTPDVIIAD